MLGHLRHLGAELDDAGPSADDAQALARKVHRVIPARRVERGAGERPDARDAGQGRLVELAHRGDDHPGVELRPVGHGDGPTTGIVVIGEALDPRTEADERTEAVGVDHLLDVLEDLRLLGVLARPDMGVERVRVERRGHVAGRTRVGVVAPGAADVLGGLEDDDRPDAGSLEAHSHAQSTEPRTDDGDLDLLHRTFPPPGGCFDRSAGRRSAACRPQPSWSAASISSRLMPSMKSTASR